MRRGAAPGYLETGSLESAQQITAQNAASPRLIDTDVGWAFRPLPDFQSLEFRIGYDLTADVRAHVARNLVYGAVRLAFGPAGFGQPGR